MRSTISPAAQIRRMLEAGLSLRRVKLFRDTAIFEALAALTGVMMFRAEMKGRAWQLASAVRAGLGIVCGPDLVLIAGTRNRLRDLAILTTLGAVCVVAWQIPRISSLPYRMRKRLGKFNQPLGLFVAFVQQDARPLHM